MSFAGQSGPRRGGAPVLFAFVLLVLSASAGVAAETRIALVIAGVILIVSKDGTKTVERNEITDPAKLIEASSALFWVIFTVDPRVSTTTPP